MKDASIRYDVQGLRGLSVLAVIVFHLNSEILPGGYVGVDVFFVISGFLMTQILLSEKSKLGMTWRLWVNFYLARLRRIGPAYYVMVLVVAGVGAVLLLPNDFDSFNESFVSASHFGSNYFFADYGDYFAPETHEQPLLHTWSLAIELQFYLIAPFLILLPPRQVLPWLLAALLVGITCWYNGCRTEYQAQVVELEPVVYYSLPLRIPEFLAGSLAALFVLANEVTKRSSRVLRGVGISLIAIATIVQPLVGPIPGLSALLPMLGAALVLLAAHGRGGLLASAPLVWLGSLSYSLYLWHWPVLAFLRYVTGAEILGVSATLAFIVSTCMLSVLSYYVVEQPVRKFRTKWRPASLVACLAGVAITSPAAFAALSAAATPEKLPIERLRYADRKHICHGHIVNDCIRGEGGSATTILVIGDSHAAMLNAFFDKLGNELGFAAKVISSSSCVTITGFDVERLPKWARTPCRQQIRAVETLLPTAKTLFIAGHWSGQTQHQEFNLALEQFLRDHSDKNIILMSQVPRFSADVARSRRLEALGLNVALERDYGYSFANKGMRKLADRFEHVRFLSLSELVFFANAPYWRAQLVYFDEHHLNEIGSREYADAARLVFESQVLPLINAQSDRLNSHRNASPNGYVGGVKKLSTLN